MSVKFKITGMEEQQDGTKRTDWIKKDGTAVKGKGGTEMMLEKMLELVPKELTDQVNIICSRVRDENLSKDKPNILWLHDTWDDPETQHLREESSLKRFDKLVFVSNYQFQTYHLAHQIPYSKSVVLKNAIVPFDKIKKSKRGKLKLIYHTTPHRGLELLVPIFETLWNDQWKDKIQLDVFSSFSMYGWPQKDEPFQAIIDRCKEHEGINYHGAVDNKIVRKALEKAHIFAYPNIWPETSCISAMEAISAGCSIVCPNHAALPETTANFAVQYQYNEDPQKHANYHVGLLNFLLENYWDENHQAKLDIMKLYADQFYDWDNRASEWQGVIQSVLQNAKSK